MPILGSFSSLSARGYGFNTTSASATASVTPSNLTEGTQITVTVNTDGIFDGTTLYYSISGTLGTITAADFTDNSLTGSFTVTSDVGTFTKTVASDGVLEDGEAFAIQIRQDSITGTVLATTNSVYIQGSQSTGVLGVSPAVSGTSFWDLDADGNIILDGANESQYTITAQTSIKFKAFIWGQGGQGSQGGLGGYSYGTFSLNQGDVLYLRLNYGGGSSGSGSGTGSSLGQDGGGLAGIFVSSTINQSNARLIAGGGGGGSPSLGGSGSADGGNGGGSSGTDGDDSPDTFSAYGGGAGSQSTGGSGGSGPAGKNGSTGSALQGGNGGAGDGAFGNPPNYVGGGGGGAGYYGGGGGGGGEDYGSGTKSAAGGGGGSGYVHATVVDGFTGGYASGSSNPNRGTAGNANTNSRIVLQGIFVFEYEGTGGNEGYSVTIPSGATSMTAKVWGAGGAGSGECSSFSGGSGGHVEGTLAVTGGSSLAVLIGGTGAGSATPGQAGSGAGNGGGYSVVKYGTNVLLAGGGGGAGQNGNGGAGGANGSGGSGSGPNNGGAGTQSSGGSGGPSNDLTGGTGRFWSFNPNDAFYRNSGGRSGGSGVSQGNRGGGGGAGYYGGGGAGGYSNSNCTGGGGGGGSGWISGSWTNTVSQSGLQGTSGGRTATDSGDEHYVSGYGGSNQNGLVVLIFE